MSASDLADLSLEEDLEIPGLPEDNQTVEEGRKQNGRVMGKLFGDEQELVFDEFRVQKDEETIRSLAGNEHRLIQYRFNLVNPVPSR